MKQIQLTQNKVALVDDADFDWLNNYNWFYMSAQRDSGYAMRNYRKENGKQSLMTMHELLIYRFPDMEIDHKDRNKLNNQKANLRSVTRSQNQRNKGLTKNNTSGYKGVHWNKSRNTWVATVALNGRPVYLGSFTNKKDAIEARKEGVLKYYI